MNDPPATKPVPEDIRPLVAMSTNNRWLCIFVIVLAIAGGLSFYALEMRRERILAPSVATIPEESSDEISATPVLNVPQDWQSAPTQLAPFRYPQQVRGSIPAINLSPRTAWPKPTQVPLRPSPLPSHQPAMGNTWHEETMPPTASSEISAAPEPPKLDRTSENEDEKNRVRATRIANPSYTVLKGTVIQAVLETALDSNRGGFARAIISRDIFSFDGTRVLIPRGSRVIGEYTSDITLGQKRMMIKWQRLTRPDGAVIEMDSPSADPLGRPGLKGSVNDHFFQRFTGMILQSALQIGGELATRRLSQNTVYIGLPGAAQSFAVAPDKIQPTVTVKQGTSVSVFVARDLDFTSVE